LRKTRNKKDIKAGLCDRVQELAVRRLAGGESVSTVVKEAGLCHQILRNWIKASAAGKLKDANSKAVKPE
jgi:hypothetical protein